MKRKGLSLGEVAELLDETSQELRFSRRLLQATMENVTQGISVVDAAMRIVAWNRRYLELVGYPWGKEGLGLGLSICDRLARLAVRGSGRVRHPGEARALQNIPLTAALITADYGADLAVRARTAGYPLLHKPLRPAALRAFLGAFRRRQFQTAAGGSRQHATG